MTNQPSLFDLPAPASYHGLPPFVRQSETSREAAIAIIEHLNPLEEKVFDFLKGRGSYGATDEEGYEAMEMAPNTYRPRRIALTNDHKKVIDSGQRRKTHAKRNAVVWIAIKEG